MFRLFVMYSSKTRDFGGAELQVVARTGLTPRWPMGDGAGAPASPEEV